jgi:hypothetical protein
MFKRQLLTLACVAGILVCGACGLMFREPPPRMTLFVGVHTMQVVVTNTSATHQLDPGGIQQALIRGFNLSTNRTHFTASTDGDADCMLSLNIVEEDAHEQKAWAGADGADWVFHAVISAKLVDKDGRVLWAKPDWSFRNVYNFEHIQQRKITPGWNEPEFLKQFDVYLASNFVVDILSK